MVSISKPDYGLEEYITKYGLKVPERTINGLIVLTLPSFRLFPEKSLDIVLSEGTLVGIKLKEPMMAVSNEGVSLMHLPVCAVMLGEYVKSYKIDRGINHDIQSVTIGAGVMEKYEENFQKLGEFYFFETLAFIGLRGGHSTMSATYEPKNGLFIPKVFGFGDGISFVNGMDFFSAEGNWRTIDSIPTVKDNRFLIVWDCENGRVLYAMVSEENIKKYIQHLNSSGDIEEFGIRRYNPILGAPYSRVAAIRAEEDFIAGISLPAIIEEEGIANLEKTLMTEVEWAKSPKMPLYYSRLNIGTQKYDK